ncbi:MAG: hypothetical protein AAFY65_07735 [Pseudomonadota bacterium]
MTKTLIALTLAVATFAGSANAMGFPTFADIVPSIEFPTDEGSLSTKSATGN